jgi:hypothetical protein
VTDEIVKRPEDALTAVEREEWQKWRRTATAPLSPAVAVRLYELFLLGHSCDDIVRANENKFPLGMVLDARLRHEWDRRREAYLERLYSEAGENVRQRQVESAVFLTDVLAAAHVEHGDKLKKFLQTRDPKDLPDVFKVTSITTYKMVIDSLMKVTGQDKKPGDTGPAVQVIANNATLNEAPKKGLTGQDALSVLKAFEQMDKKK